MKWVNMKNENKLHHDSTEKWFWHSSILNDLWHTYFCLLEMPCSHVAGFCVMIGRACKSALHGTDYPISTFCLQIYFQQKKILFHLYFLLYPVYVNIFIESYDNNSLHMPTPWIHWKVALLWLCTQSVFVPKL